jgi:acyl-CoA synthetase (AMP-forming)/AMP-acid ligase II
MNVMMLLEMASGAFPDRPAFTDGERGVTYTYSELFEAARHRAGSIRANGASRMAKLDVSNLGTPLGLFSSAWAGVPYVPLNYRLTDDEIQALLKRVTPAYLVTSADRVDALGGLDDVHAIATDSFLDAGQHPVAVEAIGPWTRTRLPCCSLPVAQPASQRPQCCDINTWLAIF